MSFGLCIYCESKLHLTFSFRQCFSVSATVWLFQDEFNMLAQPIPEHLFSENNNDDVAGASKKVNLLCEGPATEQRIKLTDF